MALLKFEKVGIKALSAVVPKNIVTTRSLTNYFSDEQIEKFIEASGVEERRFIDKDKCASDLCYEAACQIFISTNIKREDIDICIFVSQTPDYKLPGTSIILNERLELKKDTIVYDVNMSCSGFIHGLLMGFTFLNLPVVNNVLLMVGDTLSKVISLKDKSTGMLLGDGGIACVLSKGNQYGSSYFSMNTDGAFVDYVKIPAGGSRFPSSTDTLQEKEYEDGNIRTLEQVVMEGSDVFSFAISTLPKDVKQLLQFAEISMNEIDKYAFHQANNFMTKFIIKKLNADTSKVLRSIQKYGNTAGVSIPLTLVENRHLIHQNETILMSAIGAGFVYGTVLLNIADCNILKIKEL